MRPPRTGRSVSTASRPDLNPLRHAGSDEVVAAIVHGVGPADVRVGTAAGGSRVECDAQTSLLGSLRHAVRATTSDGSTKVDVGSSRLTRRYGTLTAGFASSSPVAVVGLLVAADELAHVAGDSDGCGAFLIPTGTSLPSLGIVSAMGCARGSSGTALCGLAYTACLPFSLYHWATVAV
jgi:hypothetical protein